MESELPLEMSLQGADLMRINKILNLLTETYIQETSKFRKRYNLLEALYTCVYCYIESETERREIEQELISIGQELLKAEKGNSNTFFNNKFLQLERKLRLYIKNKINNQKHQNYPL